MLIISDNKEDLIPLRTGPESLIDLFNELLAFRDIMGRVVIVSRQDLEIKIALFYNHIVWQLAFFAMALKIKIKLVEVAYVFQLPQVSVNMK